jgi:outer membrane protease
MENRDWLSSTGNYLTNYSQHNAFSRSFPGDFFSGYGTFMTELSAGYSWAFNYRFWLRAYADLSYLRFSWMSQDGYTQYGPNDPGGSAFVPWTPELPKYPYSGKAIAYMQNWIIFAPGITGGMKITDNFSFSLFALCTPLLYGECKDEHFLRGFVFIDYLLRGLYFRGGGEIHYALNTQLTFTFSSSLMNLSHARGNEDVFYRGNRVSSSTDSVGGGFSFWDFSLSLKYTF